MYLDIREAYGRDQIGLSRVEDKIALNFWSFFNNDTPFWQQNSIVKILSRTYLTKLRTYLTKLPFIVNVD